MPVYAVRTLSGELQIKSKDEDGRAYWFALGHGDRLERQPGDSFDPGETVQVPPHVGMSLGDSIRAEITARVAAAAEQAPACRWSATKHGIASTGSSRQNRFSERLFSGRQAAAIALIMLPITLSAWSIRSSYKSLVLPYQPLSESAADYEIRDEVFLETKP